MESFDIRVDVVTDPEYGSLDGFVADRRRAVVANWMGADGIWQVDITEHRPKLREFHDASNHARAHSVARGATVHERACWFVGSAAGRND
ncbi:hypothetical protein ACQPYE_27920 [Actinosynnema sp. CA-299493]